jgi:hypothetical protein
MFNSQCDDNCDDACYSDGGDDNEPKTKTSLGVGEEQQAEMNIVNGLLSLILGLTESDDTSESPADDLSQEESTMLKLLVEKSEAKLVSTEDGKSQNQIMGELIDDWADFLLYRRFNKMVPLYRIETEIRSLLKRFENIQKLALESYKKE